MYKSSDQDKVWSISVQPATYTYAVQMPREAQAEVFAVMDDEAITTLTDECNAIYQRGLILSLS